MYLSETPQLSLTAQGLQYLKVPLRSVNNEGHFIWNNPCTVQTPLYLAFYSKDHSETPQVSLTGNALKVVYVW
jgi:hypothetical protein